MTKSTPSNQESIDRELTKDINQLMRLDSGEGAVVCEVCGSVIREGERVTAYTFRLSTDSRFEIGAVFCRQHEGEYKCSWDRALRELVVRGRVGTVSDVATQSSWPVLLEPELVGVSPLGAVDAEVSDVDQSGCGAGGEDGRVGVTRSDVGQESTGRDRSGSWCDGGGAE